MTVEQDSPIVDERFICDVYRPVGQAPIVRIARVMAAGDDHNLLGDVTARVDLEIAAAIKPDVSLAKVVERVPNLFWCWLTVQTERHC